MKRPFVFSLLLVVGHSICRDGWIRFHGSCYLFRETPRESWYDSKNYCSAIKTHLVQIDDMEEYQFIKSEIKLFNMGGIVCFWTDGNDMDAEGEWIWATNQEKITQTFWTPGEPNSNNNATHDEDCINLALWQNLGWNDENCHRHCSFICEMEDEEYEVVG